jgi:hypothetical protein
VSELEEHPRDPAREAHEDPPSRLVPRGFVIGCLIVAAPVLLCLLVVLAWAAHFVWNSPWLDSHLGRSVGTSILVLVAKGLPFLILLLMLGIFARRREGQAFSRLMEEEVGSDVVTEAEFEVLRSGRRRRGALRRMKREKGPAARRLLKQLQREQMNLALFHSKVETSGHPAVDVQRDKIRRLKAQLAAVG